MQEIRPGVWKLTVSAGRYADGSPRRLHRTLRVRGRIAVSRELADFVAEVGNTRLPDDKIARDVTLDEAVERFLAYLADDKGRESGTVRDYRSVHEKWFSHHIGSTRVRDIDEVNLDRVFGKMRAAGLSASRLNAARNLYGPFFRWARRRHIITRSPMAEFEMPTSK